MSQHGPEYIWSQAVQEVLDQAKVKSFKIVQVDDTQEKIPFPFPSPEDWRDVAPIYQIMIDRFNNPKAPPKKRWNAATRDHFTLTDPDSNDLFQGGTYEGIRQQLGYLQELGVKTIWLSPVQKNCQYDKYSYHGYGIQDFLSIEPRFATNQSDPEGELKALIDEAHARGIYVIFDIVLNHAGDVFQYDGYPGDPPKNDQLPAKPYPFQWKDQGGKPNAELTDHPSEVLPNRDAAVWPRELCRKDYFRGKGSLSGDTGKGGDFWNLKEILTENPENPQNTQAVRDILIRIHQYLIAKFDIDGFRIDTLRFIEPEFARIFGNSMREFALSIGKKNFFTFGEVWGGNSLEENEQLISHFIGQNAEGKSDFVGVDAALDFPLFRMLPKALKGLENVSPKAIAELYEQRKRIQRGIIGSHGEVSKFFVTFLDNHDLNERFYCGEPYEDQLTLGITCLFTLQGIPCLYYGTEQGLYGYKHPHADLKDLVVRQALWGKPGGGFNVEHPFYKQIQALARIRATHPALRYGRQYFRPVSGDGYAFGLSSYSPGVLAFSRILDDVEIVVVANTHTEKSQTISVIVDYHLNHLDQSKQLSQQAGGNPAYCVKYSNTRVLDAYAKINYPVKFRPSAAITQLDGSTSNEPIRTITVTLQPMEAQILVRG